jgi:hypothetical protein
MPSLLIRCEKILQKTIPDERISNAEAVREETLSSFQALFTDDAAECALDYYECKFGSAFRALRIDHFNAAVSERKHLTELPEATSEEGDTMLDDEMLARLSRFAKIEPSKEDRAFLQQVLKAVDALPPDQRRAVVLRRIIGHTEEFAAALCNVDGRTIRYRLSRADAQLKKLKEDL